MAKKYLASSVDAPVQYGAGFDVYELTLSGTVANTIVKRDISTKEIIGIQGTSSSDWYISRTGADTWFPIKADTYFTIPLAGDQDSFDVKGEDEQVINFFMATYQ